ncbi:CshA/CshB family fibrillar adhesin-related protein [Actinomyces capricornis]|nr:CshA/CshB family fibrillar adhesin-related protein [Actinomyces capricornis]
MAGLLALLALGALPPVLHPSPAQAVQGNPAGGLGRYQQVIDWIDWTDGGRAALSTGSSYTRWSTPTQASARPATWRASQCTISRNSGNLVLGYEPGSWRGDGLARLYNNGANYSQGNAGRSARSGLPIGIANLDRANINNPVTVTFSVSCRTYLIFSETQPGQGAIDALPKREIPMAGMVVADAESSTWDTGRNLGESITAHADSGRYRLLESARSAGCTTDSRGEWNTFSDVTGERYTGLRLRSSSTQCSNRAGGWGPVSVLFVEGASTTNVQMIATGNSAVAFGVVGYMDFGDAPESYGAAGSAFQPTWSGGLVGTDIRSDSWFSTAFNITAAATGGQVATAGPPATRLGATTDSETSARFSPDATGDDQDAGLAGTPGAGDEDALPSHVQLSAIQGQSFRQEVACTGPGQVRGWIDWNRDGAFDPDTEASTQEECAGGSATPQWEVPLTALRSVLGEDGGTNTFMRLRISNDRLPDGSYIPLEPTGVTGSGEVEDYTASVFLPSLTLVKTVDATWAGASTLEAAHWRLSATPAQPGAAPVLSGDGGAPQAPVLPGTYTLAETETSAHPFSPGYQPQGWVCYQSPGTLVPEGYTYTSSDGPVSEAGQTTGTVEIRNQDRVTCEITNKALPTTLSWTKTDEDGRLLGGSQWSVTPVGPDGAEGRPTAVTDNSAPDTDPAEGRITVTDLAWGTYRVRETGAPTGYNLTTEVKEGRYVGGGPSSAIDLGAVVNTRITGSATWTKVNHKDQPLGGSQWTLTPVEPGGDPIEITDCEGACSEQSVDRNEAAGAFTVENLPYGRYTLVESAAPTGYRLETAPHEVAITTQGQRLDLGRILNEPITGTATWTKTDEDGVALAGSAWRLTPVDPSGTPIEIADCVLVCSEQSRDRNPAAGAFTVPDLTYGRYTLVETTAPTGYRLETAPHEVAITTQGQSVDAGAVINQRITGTLTWTKVDDEGTPLEGSQWTLTPTRPSGDAVEITDCVQVCSEQSLDKDPLPGVLSVPDVAYGRYTLVESVAPTGYRLDTTPIDAEISLQDQRLDLGPILNEPITGTVTWRKTDESGTLLGGSAWRLTPTAPGATALEIDDCAEVCPEDSADQDPTAGVLRLTGVTHGSYTLVESAAPTGYQLDTTPRQVTIDTQDQAVGLGDIVNRKSAAPAIPLTGGRGAHLFLIAGGVLSAAALLVPLIRRRRRRDAAC